MGRRRNNFDGPMPPVNHRIELDRIINDFLHNDQETYTFPAGLDNIQRKYVHMRSVQLGITSKSRGQEPDRFLTICKRVSSGESDAFDTFVLPRSASILQTFLDQSPPLKPLEQETQMQVTYNTKVTFLNGLQHVQPPKFNDLTPARNQLPIFAYRDDIIETIASHQLVLIAGETGSGKTTQVPQYIMEHASTSGKPAYIVCTQPRRISAIAMAERVSSERGEPLGSSVGYQIKLESKVSSRTVLTYCTTGVLLRALIDADLSKISHIIVDEIHERDKFTDFLMISLRELLPANPQLRLVLMSATMDMGLFLHYFKAQSPQVFDIPGRSFPVTEWFLEDILKGIKYENTLMKQMKRSSRRQQSNGSSGSMDNQWNSDRARTSLQQTVEPDIVDDLNSTLEACFNTDSEDNFAQLMQLILSYSVDVNYREPKMKLTPLMVACKQGREDVVIQLLSLRADITLTSSDGCVARDFAVSGCFERVIHALDHHMGADDFDMGSSQHQPWNGSDDDYVNEYYATVQEDFIDFELVSALVSFISQPGGVLIFLPGYEDLLACADWISRLPMAAAFDIHMLHGSMSMKNQHMVFRKPPPGKRKIVLATNVAETSITIDDVRFVIDCGRLKEKTFDSISVTSTLTTTWISKACAKQRAGRAGRTSSGYCFHVYSKKRYDYFDLNRVPEILRVPLQEICLSTKMLAPTETSIENYLNMAIQAPSVISIRNAITSLQHLGALDTSENLTSLGKHLVHLSVDPHLGKMLVFATIFKCIDPLLTIASCLAHKDPFQLPTNGLLKQDSLNIRKSFSEDALSDHMIFLRAFQRYQEEKVRHTEARFCHESFLNLATMEMISMTRSRLLAQLRAAGFVQSGSRDVMQDLNVNSNNWPLVKMVIVSGLYPNIIFSDMGKLRSRTEKKIIMHTGSCLKNSLYEKDPRSKVARNWIIFEELSKVGRFCSVRFGTVITPISVAFIGGEEIKEQMEEIEGDDDEDNEIINVLEIDGWLKFRHPGFDLIKLRQMMSQIIYNKVRDPYRFRMNSNDNKLISMIADVLRNQDIDMELGQPLEIGHKPVILQQVTETGSSFRGRNFRGRANSSRGSGSFNMSRNNFNRFNRNHEHPMQHAVGQQYFGGQQHRSGFRHQYFDQSQQPNGHMFSRNGSDSGNWRQRRGNGNVEHNFSNGFDR